MVQEAVAVATNAAMECTASISQSVLGVRTLDRLLELTFQRCLQPSIRDTQKALAPETGVLSVDSTYFIATTALLSVLEAGEIVQYTVGRTAVTITGTSGVLLAPPRLSGNESGATVGAALGTVLAVRKDWLVRLATAMPGNLAPAAVALDNPGSMAKTVREVLEHHGMDSKHTAIVLDLFHAIARVTNSLPNASVYPDARLLSCAVYDAYTWLCIQTAAKQPVTAKPTAEELESQFQFLEKNAEVLEHAKAAARHWLHGNVLTAEQTRVLRRVLQEAGWALEPQVWSSSPHPPLDLFGVGIQNGRSSPLCLLARMATKVGMLARREASKRWTSGPEHPAQTALVLPVAVGPCSDAAGRQELLALARVFERAWRGPASSGPGNDGAAALASALTLPSSAPMSHKALQRAGAPKCPTVQHLREARELYSGPSGTGHNEAAHRNLNDIFSGLGSITVPLFRRLSWIAWMRSLRNGAERGLSSASGYGRDARSVLAAAKTSAAAIMQYHVSKGPQEHPLASGPLFHLLNLADAPARYTKEDAKRDGIELGSRKSTKVTDAERQRILQVIDAAHGADVPARVLAGRVPGNISTAQVSAVMRAEGLEDTTNLQNEPHEAEQ